MVLIPLSLYGARILALFVFARSFSQSMRLSHRRKVCFATRRDPLTDGPFEPEKRGISYPHPSVQQCIRLYFVRRQGPRSTKSWIVHVSYSGGPLSSPGSLVPTADEQPTWAQLYILDSADDVQARRSNAFDLDPVTAGPVHQVRRGRDRSNGSR